MIQLSVNYFSVFYGFSRFLLLILIGFSTFSVFAVYYCCSLIVYWLILNFFLFFEHFYCGAQNFLICLINNCHKITDFESIDNTFPMNKTVRFSIYTKTKESFCFAFFSFSLYVLKSSDKTQLPKFKSIIDILTVSFK